MPPRKQVQQQGGEATQQPPPHKPSAKRKDKPKPKLTEAALTGKAPLRTFGELKALFETKKPHEEAAPVQQTAIETSQTEVSASADDTGKKAE